ncbi:hypothetical protein F441_06150 [Phytophthora nicotianae CJ01A1]|uniref:Uncharacterized protein n=1 Tax=Phytophthora nicotianae CJ01A1 TaxID=1317063 RepID=W2XBF1_PHYNI|nr:hypothetical protein F441_06150 [Phytophthora nicotianae CJ01A1]
MAGFVERQPKTRGAHLYSLLPQSKSFIPSHVTLNATTLYGLFCRIYDDPVAKEFVNGDVRLECRTKAALATWTLNRQGILRKIFNVTELETRTRKFGNQVTTDGYAASVLLQREMHTTEPTDTKTTPRKRRKTSESRVTNVVEKGTLDLALDELPDGYTPDIFIGIDPGVRC